MQRLSASNTSCLLSTAGTFGEIQIVSGREHILVDVQTRNYDTTGHLHREHALADLSLSAAAHLRDLLTDALDHAASVTLDTRQTALWSEITTKQIAGRAGRRTA